MLNLFLVAVLAVLGGVVHLRTRNTLMQRIQNLERDLQGYTDVISKVAEVQSKTYEKFTTRFEELDERIMELSVPSQDTDLPLERRHQVLALARQGVGLEDIVKKLKAPIGEAELILNLRKYRHAPIGRASKSTQQAVSHV